MNNASVFFETMIEKCFNEFNVTGELSSKIYLLATTPGDEETATICETDAPIKDFNEHPLEIMLEMAKTKHIIEKFIEQVKTEGHTLLASCHIEVLKKSKDYTIIVILGAFQFSDSRKYEVTRNKIEVDEDGIVTNVIPFIFTEVNDDEI